MPAVAVNTEPTVATIRRLPPCERQPWVERIRICYPQWQQITLAIQTCHQLQPIAAEPPCLLLIGQTGVGKTTLLTSYARTYPPRQTAEGLQQPIVQATIVPPATVKSMAATLLAALGDPAADKGTTNSMTRRVIHFFRHCQVQVLILDELQHFVDRESQKVLWTVSNWLKTLIKETGVACVLAGLANEAEQVVDANPQLARLFGDPIVLQPFAWDATQPHTITTFRALLQEIEQCLPLNEASQLAHRDLAQRCFVASSGIIGYLMALLRRATHLALLSRQERLDAALLATAFDQRLGGKRRHIPNPFLGDLPAVPAPERPIAPGAVGGTNRRSRSRTPPAPTLKDIR